jgi:hypothetical protein
MQPLLDFNRGPRLNSTIRSIAASLKNVTDVRTIDALAHHLRDETGAAYHKALIRLLPNIDPADCEWLSDSARKNLNWALLGNNRELILAILDVLRKIGDKASTRSVSRLASGKALAATDPDIKDSAAGCLLVLQARAEIQSDDEQQKRILSSLLRPSQATSEDATLLRAPNSAAAIDENLLRPAGADPGSA